MDTHSVSTDTFCMWGGKCHLLRVDHIHQEDHTQYELCDSGVCSGEIIYMFSVGQVSGLFKNFNIGMVGTFQVTASFQDSDIFQKATKMFLRCILIVNSDLSGFKL